MKTLKEFDYDLWAIEENGRKRYFARIKATGEETVVFSWIEWPDKAVRDAGTKKVMEDPRMDPSNKDNPPMPFDGQRMVYGGFTPVVELRG